MAELFLKISVKQLIDIPVEGPSFHSHEHRYWEGNGHLVHNLSPADKICNTMIFFINYLQIQKKLAKTVHFTRKHKH